jgi:hypothetical protein
VVVKFSAEVEYRAMAAATSKIIWLRLLLEDLGHNSDTSPTTLFCDNQSVIHIASNPIFHERTKYIEVNYHFVREKILNKVIRTAYI